MSIFKSLCASAFQILGENAITFSDDNGEDSIIEFEHNDIAFALLEVSPEKSTKIQLFCRYGPLPDENREKALLRLMQINFLSLSDAISAYSIDPLSAEVVFSVLGNIELITAESLAEAILVATQKAIKWKETFFFDEAPKNGQTKFINNALFA
jgi:hypothetical protein